MEPANNPLPPYLTPAAQTDLEAIWAYTAARWSPQQAERYTRDLWAGIVHLGSMPKLGHAVMEIDPPVRVHPLGSHLLVYRVEADRLVIVRIVHRRRNWRVLLQDAPLGGA